MFYLLTREIAEITERIGKLEDDSHSPQNFLYKYNEVADRLDKIDVELKELWHQISIKNDG